MINLIKATTLLICLCLNSVIGQEPLSRADISQQRPNPYNLNNFPARGGSVDVGLALSGGGIRSGSYSVGVMKSLFEEQVMDHVDVISSVSGGGYALYWTLVHEKQNGFSTFGEATFGDQSFLKNSCELQSTSRMYPVKDMVRDKGIYFFRPQRQYDKYRNAIHKTFGQTSEQGKLEDYQGLISDSGVPYLIFNTTLYPEAPKFEASVELTPFYIGNEKWGRVAWSPANPSPDLLQAVATSAAGNKSIRQIYPNFKKSIDSNNTTGVELYDGGCSENLAALPLIRSGLKHIIIVDAEHDPKLEFVSYWKLKDALSKLNIDLKVEEVESMSTKPIVFSHPCPDSLIQQVFYRSPKRDEMKKVPRAYMKGKASNKETNIESHVYYLKLSQSDDVFPPDLREILEKKGVRKNDREKAVRDHFKTGADDSLAHERNIKTFSSLTRFVFNCDAASRSKPNLSEMYSYQVNRYMYFFAELRRPKLGGLFSDFLRYDFPHTTTATQAFFPDQMEAFIGLGYLQATPLASTLKERLR